MSGISISQLPEASCHKGQDFVRTSSVKYQVLSSTTDNSYNVLQYVEASGFAIATIHPSDTSQLIVDISVELVKAQTTNVADNTSASLWHATIEYGPWDPLQYAFNGNPSSIPLKFRIDFTTEDTPAFIDVDGNPICNAAGDPYDPPLMRRVKRATLTVERNEAALSVNLNTLLSVSDTLNAATWNGFAPKTVLLNPLKVPDIKFSAPANLFYYPFQYVFDINSDTWIKQVLNAGFRQLDSAGNLIPIYVNGQPASTPVPLDETGKAILAPEFSGTGGGSGDDDGDTPPDGTDGGESGWPSGGGEPPSGGTGVASGSNSVINAYLLNRTSDFTVLGMASIFTLPAL